MGKTPKFNFYFVRHGYACSNFKSNKTIFPLNPHNSVLSDIGIVRSFNIGENTQELLPSKYIVLSSPLKRSIMTAYFQFTIHNNFPIHIVPFINELPNIAHLFGKFSKLNAHNEYDMKDPFYTNGEFYNLRIGLTQNNEESKNLIEQNMFKPDAQKFFNYVFGSIENNPQIFDNAFDSKNNEYNIVVVTHGRFISENILSRKVKYGIANNNIFKYTIEGVSKPINFHNLTPQFIKEHFVLQHFQKSNFYKTCEKLYHDIFNSKTSYETSPNEKYIENFRKAILTNKSFNGSTRGIYYLQHNLLKILNDELHSTINKNNELNKTRAKFLLSLFSFMNPYAPFLKINARYFGNKILTKKHTHTFEKNSRKKLLTRSINDVV